MANWARAFDELGTGLLRQVDIGGKAYEGAMAAEAEQRAADRALAAEERAAKRDYDKEIRAAEARESEFGRSLQHDFDIARIGHGYSMAELTKRAELQEKSDLKQFGRQAAHELKVWRMNRYAAIDDARTKAKSAKDLLNIENNVKRAESADDKVDKILALWTKAIKDGETAETDELARELGKAELQATEAWARIPGVDPLSTRQPTEFKKFTILGKEIVSAISLRTTDSTFRQAITAIKQGEGSSGYDAAIETVSRTIDDIIENDPTFKNYRGVEKRDLKKHIVEKMLPELELGEETAEGKVVDGGNGNLEKEFLGEPQKDIVDQIDVDNISKDDIGLYQREFTKYQDHGHPQLQAARVRDPSVLLPLLRKERSNMIGEKEAAAGYGMAWAEDKIKRLAKVEQIIAKLEALDPSLIDRYERDDFGNILRDKTPGVPSAALPAPQSDMQVAGIVNQPGMIFEADRISMASPDVNSRWAIPQRTP